MKVDFEVPTKITMNDALRQESFNEWAQKEALAISTNIQINLTNGVDANGGALREYSESYKKFLSSIGESTTPDLHRTGTLHNSIEMEEQPNGAHIVFTGSHRTANMANAALAELLYQRGFVGWFQIGNDDLKHLEQSFDRWVDDELKKIDFDNGG